MARSRAIATKFFKKDDLQYYKAGSFRIGTLQHYRAIENRADMGARHDPNEGIEKVILNGVAKGNGTPQSHRGINLGKHAGTIELINFTSARTIDMHIFCASKGIYKKQQHKSMLFGDGCGYEGNPELTHFAEIDLTRFRNALARELHQKRDQIKFSQFKIGTVDALYHDEIESINIFGDLPQGNEIDETVIYRKSTRFKPENEIRLFIIGDDDTTAPPPIKPFDIASAALRDSIIRFGEWKPRKK